VLTEDTIILRSIFFLWILGRPYALGRSESLDRNKSVLKIPFHTNPNIIFIGANKGNITMALDKSNYLNKIEEMLNDTNTYIKIHKNPITELAKWKIKGYISNTTYSAIY